MTAAPPLKSAFLGSIVEHNRPLMEDFKQWVFHPGMLFHAADKWWGDRGSRTVPHEGLDLCRFEDRAGTIRKVDVRTRIPAAFAGKVIKIAPDFLGQSIYLAHEIFTPRGRQLFSIYGHTAPTLQLRPGSKVAAGEIIATISPGPGSKTALAPHLHLSFAWILRPVQPGCLDWRYLARTTGITLIDPLAVLAPSE